MMNQDQAEALAELIREDLDADPDLGRAFPRGPKVYADGPNGWVVLLSNTSPYLLIHEELREWEEEHRRLLRSGWPPR